MPQVKTAYEHTIYDQLRTALSRWVELPELQWSELASIFRIKEAPQGTYLLRPGDEAYDLMFVGRGLLRVYYLNEEGEESNKAFPAENGFAGPLATALLRIPSRYGIQALEDTVLLATSYQQYLNLLDRHPIFDRLGRKILEWVLSNRELREQSLLQQTAKERYLEFTGQNPELVARLPQYHIASYLGVTNVTLSRLRSAIS